MKPHSLFEAVESYQETWFQKHKNPFHEDEAVVERFKKLLLDTSAPFSRDQFPGHLTGSCFVVNLHQDQILLLHHKKLNKWLQMGGHCDGEIEVAEVALREAWEESGTESIRLLSPKIIDLDIHEIPERKNEPKHWHYDVRFLAVCEFPNEIKLAEEEALDLAWFGWEKAFEIAREPSMHRVFQKIKSKGAIQGARESGQGGA